MLTAAQKAKYDNSAPFEGLDKVVNQKRGAVKGCYDFAVQGGATGTIYLKDENGDVIELPNKAIITQSYMDVITACTSAGGAGTIALGVNTTTDIKAAVDADTLSGVVANIPVGVAANMVKLTAARKLALTIGTEALTAGKFNVFLEFVISD